MNLKAKDLHDHISIVTGGNSGIGYSVAEQLVSLGSKVILACRDDVLCNNAAMKIRTKYPLKKDLVYTMNLDLNDLTNVKKFTDEFIKRFKRLDILVNNAGVVAKPGELTVQGLEKSFGVMHIGHFALTKWLLKLMLKPLPAITSSTSSSSQYNSLAHAARVINVASDAMLVGNFHPSFMLGNGAGDLMNEITDNCGNLLGGTIECCPAFACPHTNGYARAKLANVMHAYELQRRVDELIESSTKKGQTISKNYRRLVTSSLHPGTVHTNIHPFLQSEFTSYLTRSAKEAAYVVLHAILEDSYVPSAYIDSMRRSHDLFDYEKNGLLVRHTALFPQVKAMPLITMVNTTNMIKERVDYMAQYGLHTLVWKNKAFIVGQIQQPTTNHSTTSTSTTTISKNNNNNNVVEDSNKVYTKQEVSSRLWDLSEKIISDWSNHKPILIKGSSETIKISTSLKL